MDSWKLLVATLGVAALLLLASPSTAAIGLLLEADRVEVEGASANGRVLVVGVGRQLDGYVSFIRTTAENVVADAAGVASYAIPWTNENIAAWVAVDVESGAFSVATSRQGGPSHELIEHPAGAEITLRARRLQVALVRPGVGAWLSAIADGGARDADGLSDGELTISPLELVSLGGESLAPQSLEARDVVIAIDQDTLEVAVMSLVPALQGGE